MVTATATVVAAAYAARGCLFSSWFKLNWCYHLEFMVGEIVAAAACNNQSGLLTSTSFSTTIIIIATTQTTHFLKSLNVCVASSSLSVIYLLSSSWIIYFHNLSIVKILTKVLVWIFGQLPPGCLLLLLKLFAFFAFRICIGTSTYA